MSDQTKPTVSDLEQKSTTVEPVSAPQSTPSTQLIQKENHTTRNVLIVGCLLLLCCCCILPIITLAVAPRTLFSFVTPSRQNDPSLTTITQEELQSNNSQPEKFLEDKKADAIAESGDAATYTVELTEKEVLTSILGNAHGIDPSAFGLKFENGSARMQLDVGKLMEAAKSNPQAAQALGNLSISPEMLNGLVVTADISTSADGKSISIENLTTGNQLIDSLIPQDLKNQLGGQINLQDIAQQGAEGEQVSGEQIESIKFVDGAMRIEYMK